MIGWCRIHGSFENFCAKCAAEKAAPPPAAETVVTGGLDLAKLHDYSAMIDGDITFHKATVKGVKMWPHVDYTVVVKEVAGRYRRRGMHMLAFDETGVGEPIKEMLFANGVRAEGIKYSQVLEWTNPWGDRERAPVKYAMVEYGRACMQAGYVEIPSKGAAAQELIKQLSQQEIAPTTSDRVKYAHPEGLHDDLAWAFLMWLYVSRTWLTGNGIFMEAGTHAATEKNFYAGWSGIRP